MYIMMTVIVANGLVLLLLVDQDLVVADILEVLVRTDILDQPVLDILDQQALSQVMLDQPELDILDQQLAVD
jgi:hypothetical protein